METSKSSLSDKGSDFIDVVGVVDKVPYTGLSVSETEICRDESLTNSLVFNSLSLVTLSKHVRQASLSGSAMAQQIQQEFPLGRERWAGGKFLLAGRPPMVGVTMS